MSFQLGGQPQPKPVGAKPQETDLLFPEAASDSYSCMTLNGGPQQQTNIVCAGSWDNSVKCFQLQYNGPQLVGVNPQPGIQHDGPVLCADFSTDNVTCFSAGCDSQVRMWNVTQGPQAVSVIGKHDQPVKAMKWMPEMNCLATASWDKTIRLWDCRQQNPAMSLQLNERIYTMDAAGKVLVCTTADNEVHAYPDLSQPNQKFAYKSPLKYQARSISIFHDREGFALGCIEGRVAIEYFSEIAAKAANPNSTQKPPNARSFVFKCHREATSNDIYGVNAIDFHHQNTFVTAGGDGSMAWWDKDARSRLATRDLFKMKCPISAAKFTPMGDALIYVLAYDWSRGAHGLNHCKHNEIRYHAVNPQDIAAKPKKR